MSYYLDGDTADQCMELLRQGVSLDHIAGRLGCSADELCRLLGLPSWTPEPTADADCDLWAADALDGQL